MGRGPGKLQAYYAALLDLMLVVIALFAPLSMGAVHAWSRNILFGLIALTLLLTLVERKARGRSLRWPALAFLPLTAALFSFLQLVPVPPFLLKLLSPEAYAIGQISLWPLGDTGWQALSLDPPATWLNLAHYLAYTALLLVAYQAVHRRHAWRKVLGPVAISAVVVLLVSVLMTLAKLSGPYGHNTLGLSSWVVTPFINPNHASAFFGLGAFATAAVAVSQRERSRAVLWWISVIALMAAVPLTLSRGGILALVASLIFVGWLLYSRQRVQGGRLFIVHIVVLLAILLSSYLAYEPISRELATLVQETDRVEAKQALWNDVIRTSPKFALTGMGRGAFSLAYPRYKSLSHNVTFEFVEDAPLQLLIDFGWLGGGLLLLVSALFFAALLRRARKARAIILSAALFFIAMQNLADFSLEVPGVVVALILMAALALPKRSKRSWRTGWSLLCYWRLQTRLLFVPLGLMLLLMVLSLIQAETWGPGPRREILQGQVAGHDLRQKAMQALRHHPADYALALVIARSYLQPKTRDSKKALSWLGRAIQLNPGYAPSYRDVARLLWRRGARAQALENWRMATEKSSGLTGKVIADLLRLKARYPELSAGVSPAQHFALCRSLWRAKRGDEARQCADDYLDKNDQDADVLYTVSLWALQKKDMQRASVLATALAELNPRDARAYLVQGRIAQQTGDVDGAKKIWQQFSSQVQDPRPLLQALFQTELRQKDFVRARKLLQQLAPLQRRSAAESAQWHDQSGRLYLAQGQIAKALRAFRAAQGLAPQVMTYGLRAAQCQERLGQNHRALLYYEKLTERFPHSEVLQKAIARLQQRLQQAEEKARYKNLGK